MPVKENIINVPNALSLYRLLTFPVILYLIYSEQSQWFAILLCVNLVTDILDGLIARLFKLQTEFGAKLDSLADNGTYIAAILGIFKFKMAVMASDLWMLWLFIGMYLLGLLIALLKFKQAPSLHLYTTRIGGYVQGSFMFVLFAWGYQPWLFYTAMILGYISHIEECVILVYLKERRSDVKGLYWILKAS